MDLGLAGKRALVTGASSGLGLGCARALAAEGARVALVARSPERLGAATATVGGETMSVAADVSDPDDTERMISEVESSLGGVDILIANAGGPPPGTFATTDLDAYRPAMELNLLSTITMCKNIIPTMQERGWGRVVAITSIAAREPIETLILSNTARAGLTAFLKTTAREVAGDGVTVNSLQPGLHLTDRLATIHGDTAGLAAGVPAQQLGDPDDFGAIAAFLCSDAAKFVTGTALLVDGGAARGMQ